MAEYIDREKIISKTCSNCTRQIDLSCQYEKPCEHLIAAFLNEDCADVVLAVHAKWENNKDEYPECTNCGYMPMFDPAIDDIYYSPYCPDCGAKMDL